jgi:hypothetical protein
LTSKNLESSPTKSEDLTRQQAGNKWDFSKWEQPSGKKTGFARKNPRVKILRWTWKTYIFFENDLHTVGLPCLCYSSLGSSKNAAIFNRKNGDLTANHWDSTNTYGGCITNRSSGTKNDKLIGHPPNKNSQNECY